MKLLFSFDFWITMALLIFGAIMGMIVFRSRIRSVTTEQPPKIITEVVGTNAFSYMRPSPSRKLINGTQDRYIDWPYPPLRTNLTQYEIIPGHGTAYIYFCNDGQLRWSFSPVKP